MSENVIKKVSAGVIPYRKREGEVEYFLLSQELGHWGFPKGPLEEDEEITAAALRVLEEEISIPADKIELDIGTERTIKYTYEREGQKHQKTVYFYPGEVDPEVEVNIASQFKDYEWVSFEEAAVQITYPDPVRILEEFHNQKYGEDTSEPLIDTSLLDE